jgi:drug/metabolite transporter (DMT)-like permease
MKPRELVAFVVCAILCGSSFLWFKVAGRELGAWTIASGRLFFGCVSLAPYLLITGAKPPKKAAVYVRLLILGVLNNSIPFFLMSWGEQRIDSSMAAALEATMPLLTALLAHFFMRGERLTRRRVLGLGVGLFGVLVLLGDTLHVGSVGMAQLLGQGALLVAALFYSVSSIFAARALAGVPAPTKAFFSMASALVFTVAGALAFDRPLHWPEHAITWVSLVSLGVLCSCIGWVLYYWLIQTMGPSRAMLVMYAMTVVGVLMGVVFLHEPLTWSLGAGTLLIVGGIAIFGR